jgi:hypothetical protein
MPIRRFIKTVALCSLSLMSMAAMSQQFRVQQFNQPLVIPTGGWPAGIVAADLNGDGKADLIYIDYGATATASTTHVLLNSGNGTFTPGQTISTVGTAIAAADFDHDGHVDLVWVRGVVGEGRVYRARGNGDGTFAPAQELGTFARRDECSDVPVCDGRAVARYGVHGCAGRRCGESFAGYADNE